MNFIGGTLTLLAITLVLVLPRPGALLGVFIGICYITQGQAIEIGGFNFQGAWSSAWVAAVAIGRRLRG